MLTLLAIGGTLSADAQTAAPGQNQSAASASPAAAGKTGKLEFDAASIRPSGTTGSMKGWFFLDPASSAEPPKGGLFSWNVPLPVLIRFAYDIRNGHVASKMQEQLPKWAHDPQTSWYTIEARAEGNPTRAEVRQMVRSLLEDRFQFAAHRETREEPVYGLVVDKPALTPKPHAEGAPCAIPSPAPAFAYPSYQMLPAHCGVFDRELSTKGLVRHLEMLNVTMQQVADALGNHLPIPVLDRSGVEGRVDAVLDYGPNNVPLDTDPTEEVAPPLQVALGKQLGLKLVKQTGTVDIFVIDRIEQLSEN